MTVSKLFHGWTKIPLKFLFTHRVSGAWGKDPKDGEGVICIRAADFLTDKIRHRITNLTRREYEPQEIFTRQLKPGDLIIEKSGGGDNQPVGRVVSFNLNQPALCSNFLELVRPNPKVIYSRFGAYLLYSFWSNRIVFAFIKQTTGIQNLDIEEYFSQEVSIPPLSRQIAIANYLDRETAKIDTLISAKERLLDLLTEKRRALITHAVTRGLNHYSPMTDSGMKLFGNIPRHWKITKLRWFVKTLEQGWSPQAEERELAEQEWGVLKLNAVKEGQFDDSKAKALPLCIDIPINLEIRPGDFLITRGNTPDLVGDVCYVSKTKPNLILSDLIYRLRLDESKLNGKFLSFFLQSHIGRLQIVADARGSSASMVKISQEHILDWLVPIPPLKEQQDILAYIETELSKLDLLQSVTKRTLDLLNERRAALITAGVSRNLSIS